MTWCETEQSNRAAAKAPTPLVLCIDDDPEVSRLVERCLADWDVKVMRAFHGMQGFAAATKYAPSVIVMDVAMPSGDGPTVLEWLRRNPATARLPVILLSGMRDRRIPRRMFELGADQFLHKPIHCDRLRHELSRFIDLRPVE